MLFSFMLSFQLAGGLILLLNGLKTSKQAIIKNCFPGTNVVERDNEDNCVIPKEKMQASACSVFLNNVGDRDDAGHVGGRWTDAGWNSAGRNLRFERADAQAPEVNG